MSEKQQLAYLVTGYVERVLAGNRIEDDLFEAKADWPPDDGKFARRLGGQANKASGAKIVVVFGLDEDNFRFSDLDGSIDPATWWNQIESRFDGPTPDPIAEAKLPFDSGEVYAFLFDTSLRPYVVKNPKGGAFQRDVPWRKGTRVESATYADLIRLYREIAGPPDVYPYMAEVGVSWDKDSDNFRVVAKAQIVFHPGTDQHALLLVRDVHGLITLHQKLETESEIFTVEVHGPDGVHFEEAPGSVPTTRSSIYREGGAELHVTAPGLALVELRRASDPIPAHHGPEDILPSTERVSVDVRFRFSSYDRASRVNFPSLVPDRLDADRAHFIGYG